MSYDVGKLEAMKRQWIVLNSNIPRRFLGMDPKDILAKTGEWPEIVEDWLESAIAGKNIKQIGGLGTTGVGLLFAGKAGLGKTTHAVTTLMEFIRNLPEDEDKARSILGMSSSDFGMSARPIYYMTYPEFLSRKKAMIDADPETKKELYMEMEGFHGRAKEDWLNVRVLVLDDLGKEYKGSGYNDASFDEILRSRYDKGLPTIITTNIARENWKTQYGEAMGSFVYEAFSLVSLDNGDLRKGTK